MATPDIRLDEIKDGVYRISTFVAFPADSPIALHPDLPEPPKTFIEDSPFGLTFNQFLIVDESPTLIHTGMAELFEGVTGKIREVLDPKRLKFIVISHFEADECGALHRFLEIGNGLQPVATPATELNIVGFGYKCKPYVVKHGDRLVLGSKALRFLGFPSNVHLWDGLVAYEETNSILFSGDLCMRWGEAPEPIVGADIDQEILNIKKDWFNIPDENKRSRPFQAVRKLKIDLIAPMHGPALERSKAAKKRLHLVG